MKTQAARRFKNRQDAGRRLARSMAEFASLRDVVILAFPNGGIAVAVEIARALGKPLDILIMREITHPDDQGIVLGTITSGGVRALNCALIDQLHLSDAEVSAAILRECAELARCEKLYRHDHPSLSVADKTVILVDDCVTPCHLFRDAIHLLRRQHADHIVVALPAASCHDSCDLRLEADEVFSLTETDSCGTPEKWFRKFPPASDEKACRILDREWSAV
ncbi:MAG: phosphoribosyltransferase family protein [Luteolibacter sp.]